MVNFQAQAYHIFGRYFRKKKEDFYHLQNDILGARMLISVDSWLSTSFFATILSLVTYLSLVYTAKYLLNLPRSLDFVTKLPLYFIHYLMYLKGISAYLASLKATPLLLSSYLMYLKGISAYLASLKVVPNFIAFNKILFLSMTLTLAEITVGYLIWTSKEEKRREYEERVPVHPLHRASAIIGIIALALVFLVILAVLSRSVRGFLMEHPTASIYVIGSLFITTAVYSSFYFYPKITAWERGLRIDALAPYAIGYLSTLSRVGMSPYVAFKELSDEPVFKEVSLEVKQIVRDVEVLGIDFISSLHRLSTITPSRNLRVFLQGAISTSISGGEERTYFISKSRDLMEETRRKLEDFIETLGLISEVFIIAVVAAPIFIVVMLLTLSLMGRADISLLFMVAYVVIPGGALMFLILIETLSPGGG